MEEFPANSNKSKEDAVPDPKATGNNSIEPKKVEKIVTGEVIRKKPPLGKRLAETFIGGEAKSVGNYVLFEVMIPALRDTVVDIIKSGAERMFYGEPRSSSRQHTSRYGAGSASYVSYDRYSKPGGRPVREESVEVDRRTRASHDFSAILIPSREEAENVLDGMFDLIERYNMVTVEDFYNLLGVTPDYTDQKYGWTSIMGARVARAGNSGYFIIDNLPKTEHLKIR